MSIVNVLFKKLYEDAILPTKAHEDDTCFDLYCHLQQESIELLPNERLMIECGFAMAMPKGWEAQIRPRSGLAKNFGLTVLNSPGSVDSNYRGQICVILINHGKRAVKIENETRIAQMAIKEVPFIDVEVVNELPESDRNENGFGSSGLK